MIPNGWTATTIGQHADVLTGFAFKSADYTSNENDVKLLRGDNVAPHGLRWRDVKRFPEVRSNEVSRYQLRAGDFVVAMDRTWLPSGVKIAEVTQADLPCLLVQRVARLRAKDTLHQGLMKQFFSGHQFDQYVQAVQTETAVPHISPADLRDYPIKLPPLPEQRRIAEILSNWDRAIETVEALIANARTQKKALMQLLLAGYKRLPGFSGPWTETPISRMGAVVAGGTPDSTNPDYWGGDIAWATPTDITKLRTRHIAGTERYVTPLGLSSSSAKRLPVGTVIVCTRATVGALAIAAVPMATNQGFKNIVPNAKHNSDFVYYLLRQNKKALVRAAGGSTFAEVSKADFEKLTFQVPCIDEQRSIAAVLICADEALEKLQSKLTMLQQEKSALMQQLLTGKRRVKVTEEEPA